MSRIGPSSRNDYKADPIADDSEDEKWMKAAERSALTATKASDMKSRNQRKAAEI